MGTTSWKKTSVWTLAKDLELRTLWDLGHTTKEIGRALGVSKNSAISRAHRIGLSRPAPAAIVAARALGRGVRKADEGPKIGPAECHYVTGGSYCGLPTVDNTSWCDVHKRLVYVKHEANR